MCAVWGIPPMTGTTAILTPMSNNAAAIFAQDISLGEGVIAGPVPGWTHEASFLKEMGPFYDDTIRNAKYALRIPYDSKEWGERHPTILNQTVAGDAKERVYLAILSLWLAKPSWVGIGTIVQFAGLRDGFRHIEVGEGVKPHLNHEHNVLDTDDITLAKDLLSKFPSVPRTSAVWRATRFLLRSTSEEWWDARYLATWVALEALFSPNSRRRVTKFLRRRISSFLHQDEKDREEASRRVNELYDWRSKLAHGESLDGLDDNRSAAVSFESEELLRLSLRKILLEKSLIQKFASIEREAFLDSIAPARRGSPSR